MTESPKRKLAAIMFTDMVGYTAMMERDEPKARETIERHRKIMKPLVEKHGGEVLQFVGDGTFCTFESAIEAVNCSIEIQREFNKDEEISIRIGIHIGDVVADGEEVYGDGVNVAARLEPLAAEGGICLSGEVSNNLKNQPGIETVYLGRKKLKNVEHPVEVYALSGEGLVVPDVSKEEPVEDSKPISVSPSEADKPNGKRRIISAAALFLAVISIFLVIKFIGGGEGVQEVTADENSLAVLFIENINDPEDSEHEAEMLKELLITDLSQSKILQVISSQRLFDLAKQNRGNGGGIIDKDNASEIARKAGAQWMLVGKLARLGSRNVLTTQIANVRSGKILNAQRADGNDFFAMVDKISLEVRQHLGVEVEGETDLPVAVATTESSEAYQYYTQGITFLNKSEFRKAVKKFERSLELDPEFTQALFKLAISYWWADVGGDERAKGSLQRLLDLKEKLSEKEELLAEAFLAIVSAKFVESIELFKNLKELFPKEKEIYYGLGEAYFHSSGNNVKALDAFEKVLEFDPTFNLVYGHIFNIYSEQELFERGIETVNRIIELSPDNLENYRSLGNLYRDQGDYDNAMENYQIAMRLDPDEHRTYRSIAGIYRRQGNFEAALAKIDEMTELDLPSGHKTEPILEKVDIYLRKGESRKAIMLLNDALANLDSTEFASEESINFLLFNGYFSVGEYEDANNALMRILEKDLDPLFTMVARYLEGQIYIETKDISKLDNLIKVLKEYTEENTSALAWTKFAHNALLFHRNILTEEYNAALLEYSGLSRNVQWRDRLLYDKALIHSYQGDFDKAIEAVRSLERPNVNTSMGPILKSDLMYLKGRILGENGDTKLAVEEYQKLLEFWRDADDELLKKKDTIKRLANLRKQL